VSSTVWSSKITIRSRILLFILALIIAIFLVILTVFNILVREYIKNDVNEQLREVIKTDFIEQDNTRQPMKIELTPSGQQVGFIPDLRRLPGGPLGTADAIIISENYELLFPDANMLFMQRHEEITTLVEQMKTGQTDLQNTEITKLTTPDREYYLVSVELPDIAIGNIAYLVYYIDMTAITSFAGRINSVLLIVMGIAGILAAVVATFLSGIIARPIKELTRFAARIGKGDFSNNMVNYREVELAELAESMNKAANQLDTYDREQKTFFQNVSHELRTPLQAIRCSAEGIEHGILDNKQSSRVIISETDRLSEMVEDLLYLSRIDNLLEDTEFVEHDLRELLSNSAERQRNLAAGREVTIVFEFDNQPVNFCCDEKHISRAFSNLISNAIRYAKSKITLSCRRNNGQIIVLVSDDGSGIAQEDLPHVFDRFYKGKDGKHGIGLSIVKTVIGQHGGKIEIKSGARGTTFMITL